MNAELREQMKKERATKATMTIRTDALTKRQFSIFCDAIGIPVSTVINAMLRQAIRKQEINITTLDLNGLTPTEARELKRRYDDFKAAQAKMREIPDD